MKNKQLESYAVKDKKENNILKIQKNTGSNESATVSYSSIQRPMQKNS